MTTTSALPGPTPTRVLFVGDDASSPQIAASLLRRLAGDRLVVETADTHELERGGRSDEMLVAMGLNPAEEHLLSSRLLYTADRVVVLGTGLDVARLAGPRYEDWDLEHEDLAGRIEALGAELLAPAVRRPTVLGRLRMLLERVLDRLRTLLESVLHRLRALRRG